MLHGITGCSFRSKNSKTECSCNYTGN
jgi:hypothetical protein